ncbi:MAG: hypothetical protein JWP97_2067 [Labilithrix sp.]|nr:hypothetical protein [Labilithrix sp.]
MAMPMIRVLRRHHPTVTIDAAGMTDGIVSVLRRCPEVSEVMRVALYGNGTDLGHAARASLALRRREYSASILAYPAFRREYHAFHRSLGARRRIAHRFVRGYWSELNFLETDLVPADPGVHNVINNLRLLAPLGIDLREDEGVDPFTYSLGFGAEERASGAAALEAAGFSPSRTVGIHPGSTISPAALRRRWVPERWAAVCQHLADREGQQVAVFAGPEEGDLGARIVALADRPEHVRLAPGRGFAGVLEVLSACRMLVSCDNGFGHLGVALQVPVVGLFGVTEHRWSGPYSRTLFTPVTPVPYRPWHRYELKRAVPANAHDGMRDITVEAVVGAVAERLTKMAAT